MPKLTYGNKSDMNQTEIVAALRSVGAGVIDLHNVGNDCPDLLVGRCGFNFLVEVKTATGKLSAGQIIFHRDWSGQIAVAHSIDEALQIIGAVRYTIGGTTWSPGG